MVLSGLPFAIMQVECTFRLMVAAICAWVAFTLDLEYISVKQFSQIDCQPFSFYINHRRARDGFFLGFLGYLAHRDPGIYRLDVLLRKISHPDS